MLQKFDERNQNIKVFIKDRLYDREDAKVSVFDSTVQGGDGVWEGLRRHKEGILHLSHHLKRMRDSAKALAFTDIPDEDFIRSAIKETLEANDMHDEVHIRLTLSRGMKITSGMDPRLNQDGACLIVLAEWKPFVYDNESGMKVITSTQRRNGPQFLDSKIHHNNLLNNILAKIQANVAGVDAAIMLDERGFIAELNDTNIFMLEAGKLITPRATACLPGITRRFVMDTAREIGVEVKEVDISLAEFYASDFAFATGTMGGLTPIREADGRMIGSEAGEELFEKLNAAVIGAIPSQCEEL